LTHNHVYTYRCRWTKWAFINYWFSDLITISTWMQASAIMTTGLSAPDALLIVLAAGICNAAPTVLNGALGSELHVAFPIAARASYGYRLSYFCVVARGVLALFWFGVQSANGGGALPPCSRPSGPATPAYRTGSRGRPAPPAATC